MFPVLAGNKPASTGYNLTRSLRFRASAGGYLSRTNTGTVTNNAVWTWSAWVKIGYWSPGNAAILFGVGDTASANECSIKFVNNELNVINYVSSTVQARRITTQVFRDPSAWYHIVVASNSSTALNIYANGVQITSFGTSVGPSAAAWALNSASAAARIGFITNAQNFDGEMTEINFIDGQALTPSSFGSTNATTGVWQPAAYTGTYGTNGFYLPFTDNSALTTSSNVGLGKDFSGNGNYWATNNISITAGVTYDSMTDVPTLTSATASNFAVINPLFNGSVTVSAGNLNASVPGAGYQSSVSTIAFPTSGKFYFEVTIVSNNGSGNNQQMGITALPLGVYNFGLDCFATSGTSARKVNNGTVGADLYGPVSNGTVFGVAVDATNGKAYIAVNNTYIDSSSPTGGTGGYSMISGQQYFALFNGYSSGVNAYNFGQRPFTYSPPTGFVALNTYNLPTSTIVKGNTVMDATLYTGTLLSNAITNAASFKPDLVWIKSRSAATDNKLTDSVRGVTKGLISNTTGAETTDTQGLTAFGSAGFTVGTNTDYNNLAATYVAWQWQAGQGSSGSNTNGTITSTVSVNASAGFSVVTYTGTGANATVGHGLGVAPAFIIGKKRSAAGSWQCWQATLGGTQYISLNGSAGVNTSATVFNGSPTSTIFNLGTDTDLNASGATNVAYCWSEIAGYSKFGSYTGNGSADGPFVYCGLLPRFLLIKRTDTTASWRIFDTARDPSNVEGYELYPNLSNAESSFAATLDGLSNGFKIRSSDVAYNASGGTYIFAAFASNPFKNSLAR